MNTKHKTATIFLSKHNQSVGNPAQNESAKQLAFWRDVLRTSWLLQIAMSITFLLCISVLVGCASTSTATTTAAEIQTEAPAAAEAVTADTTDTSTPEPSCWIISAPPVCSSFDTKVSQSVVRVVTTVTVLPIDYDGGLLHITVPHQANHPNAQIILLPWREEVPSDEKLKVVNFEVAEPDSDTPIADFSPAIQLQVECPDGGCSSDNYDCESTPQYYLQYYDETKRKWILFTKEKNDLQCLQQGEKWLIQVDVTQWGDRHIAWGPIP